MVSILIVAATKKEIQPLVSCFETIQNVGNNMCSGVCRGSQIDCLITGPGIMATSYWLGRISLNMSSKYSLIINAGIAGSFKSSIKIGSVVQVISDCNFDFGAEDGDAFLSASEISLLPENELFLRNSYESSNVINSLKKVNAITVNKVHGREKSIQLLKTKIKAEIESMEGAAFFNAARKQDSPYVQIRSISNFVERRNKANWEIENAITSLNKVLVSVIDEMVENILNE
jgi:futalosine hydrolase